MADAVTVFSSTVTDIRTDHCPVPLALDDACIDGIRIPWEAGG